MKKMVFALFVSVIGFIACKDKKPAAGEEAKDQKTTELVQDPAKDSAEIRTVITGFYNWYNKNYATLQEYKLYSSIKKKEAPPYKINWDVVERYQQFIRDSVPQLGEEFIKNQKHFFQQCDSAFKVDVEDDIPYGFDYDWYTNSQEETQYLVDEVNKSLPWVITRSGDHAMVEVKGEYENNGKKSTGTAITIVMKKENGKWKIAKTLTE
jgi:hypothetical protein